MKLKLPPLKLASRAEDEAIRRYLNEDFDSEPSSPTDEFMDRPTLPIGIELALKDSCDALKELMKNNGDYEEEESDEPREKKARKQVINFSIPSKATRSSSMPRHETLPAEGEDGEMEPVPAIKSIAAEDEPEANKEAETLAPVDDRPSTPGKSKPLTDDSPDRRESTLSNMFHRFSGFKPFDLTPLDTSVGNLEAPSRPKTAPASHATDRSISDSAAATELFPTSALTGITLIGASPARASHDTTVQPISLESSDLAHESESDDESDASKISGEAYHLQTAESDVVMPEKKGLVKSITSFVRSRSKSISRIKDASERQESTGGLLRSLSMRRNKSMGNLNRPTSKHGKLQKYAVAQPLCNAPPMPSNSKEVFAKHSVSASRNLDVHLVADLDGSHSMLPPATPVSFRSAKATAVEISSKKSRPSTLQPISLPKENAVEPSQACDSLEPLPFPTRKQSIAGSSIDSCFSDPQTPDRIITSPLHSHPVSKPLPAAAKSGAPPAKYSIMPPAASPANRVYTHSHASSAGSSIVYLPSQMPESPMLRTFPMSSLSQNVTAGPEPMVNFSRKLTGLSDDWKRASQATIDVTALPPVPRTKEKVLRRVLSSFGLRRKN